MKLNEKLSRDRVNGFLRCENGRIVNGRGEEILLVGMGVGNWLLPEGYMWKFGERYNRPHRIGRLVRDLCGTEYAVKFWRSFRENYITEEDVSPFTICSSLMEVITSSSKPSMVKLRALLVEAGTVK